MTTAQTPDTPESWNAASRGYAEHVAPLMMEIFAEEFVDRLDVRAETTVLEVAAGSGAITNTLARRAKSVLATDFAPEMIGVLRERLRTNGITNVQTSVMDGQALELSDASFDRAICSFGLMLFPDRAKGFSELHRVLRPSGRALVSGWAGPDKFEGFGLFLAALRAAFPDMPPPPRPPPVFSLSDPARFAAEMEAAGFDDVEVEFVARDVEVASFEDLWSMFTAGAPPAQMLLDRVGIDGAARLRETMASIVQERYGGGPVCCTNVATLGTGLARS